MKSKYIYIIFLFLFLFIGNINSLAQQTKLLTAEKHNEYGLIYTLPITSFRVEVTAVKEISIAGPFYEYAKKFAGTDRVVKESQEKWSIEEVRVIPYGIPDPDARYLMQLKAGATTFIGVGEDGMLLSINTEPKLALAETNNIADNENKATTGKEYLQYVNEDFISAQSSYKKAQLLGEELMEIRDAKISLTRGTAETMPTDGRQLEIMLQSLDHQEKALTQAFTGNVWTEKFIRNYTVTPDEEGRVVLFRFNDFAGFVEADDYSGEPVYLDLKLIEEASLPVDAKGEEKKLPKDAVVYCVPGTANLSISFLGNSLFSKNFEMSQFGLIFGLNPSLFTDKKEPSYAIFDPATGALKELGVLK